MRLAALTRSCLKKQRRLDFIKNTIIQVSF